MRSKLFRLALFLTLAAALWFAARRPSAPTGPSPETPEASSSSSSLLPEEAVPFRAPVTPCFKTAYDFAGVTVHVSDVDALRLRLERLGREHAPPLRISSRPPFRLEDRTEFRHDWGREWYVDRPQGLEQLFEIRHRAEGNGPLLIEIRASGMSLDRFWEDGAIFTSSNGSRLRYSKLVVEDAKKTRVPARITATSAPSGETLLALAIDDRDAVYPLLVDPLISTPEDDADLGAYTGFFGSEAVLVAPDGTVIMGGGWTSVSSQHSGLVQLRKSSALPTPGFPQLRGTGVQEIRAIVGDGSGGWFVAGSFFGIGGDLNVRHLAHILADGTLDGAFVPDPNQAVNALVLDGGTLYIGGQFTQVSGTPRNRLAAVDATTGALLAWDPDSSGIVETLVDGGTTLFVGGSFTTMGLSARARLAEVDKTTAVATAWNPVADDTVTTMAVGPSTVYVGGDFASAGGSPRTFLAGLDRTTGAATAWDPVPATPVDALALDGTTLYVGGDFTTIAGQTRFRVAAFDTTTDLLTAWVPGVFNGGVHAISPQGATVYIGGQFTFVDGAPAQRVVELDATTGSRTSWPGQVSATDVLALGVSADHVVVGGDNLRGGALELRSRLAVFDPFTGRPTPLQVDANGTVRALALDGTTLYVGGDFTQIGGVNRDRIAAVDLSTGTVLPWDPGANNTVNVIRVDGTTVYAGGSFTSIGGQTRNRIAALDSATGNATAWDPDAGLPVHVIEVSGTSVYVGGEFSTIGGVIRDFLAEIDSGTGLATAWNPSPDGIVRAILPDGALVYVGGEFLNVGGAARNRIAALDSTTGLATAWDPDASNTVHTLHQVGTSIYAAGIFSQIGGMNRGGAAEIDSTTGLPSAWNPQTEGGSPRFVACVGDSLYLGGPYSAARRKGQRGLARYGPLRVIGSGALSLNGLFGVSDTITVVIDFSRPVLVTGTPQLTLETGVTDTVADYVGGSGSATLRFQLTVVAGRDTVDLDYVGTGSLALNGGTIQDGLGNDADLTLAPPGGLGSIAYDHDIVIDTVAPAAPSTPDLDAASDTGSSPTDDRTNDVTPMFTGTAQPFSTVELLADGNPVGSIAADGAGNWAITSSALAEGPRVITATATDVGGTSSPSAGLVVTIDLTAPPPPAITSPVFGTTVGFMAIPLVGTAEPGAIVRIFMEGIFQGQAIADGLGDWNFETVPLPDGTYIFTTDATDTAGNLGSLSAGHTVTVDVLAPVVAIVNPTTGPTFMTGITPITVDGSAADGNGIATVTWDNAAGGSGPATGTTSWTASIPLVEGPNLITITATDGEGTTGTDTLTITLDSTLPAITIQTPTTDPSFMGTLSPVTLGGVASDTESVASVDWENVSTGAAGAATGTTTWTADVPLDPGGNLIVVTVTDGSGNTATDEITVVYDTRPVLNILAPPEGSQTALPTAALTGDSMDSDGVSLVTWINETSGDFGAATGTTAWTANVPLRPGLNTITVIAWDTLGNSSLQTLTVELTGGDETPPAVSITGPTTASTFNAIASPVTLDGTASDDVAVASVTWSNGATGATGTATGTTTWTADVPLLAGDNLITVTATDTSGNTVTDTITVMLSPPDDGIDPTVSIDTPTAGSLHPTATTPVVLGGTASDDQDVVVVIWENLTSKGGGVATGTTAWTATVAVVPGANLISVTAIDAAGNLGFASLIIDYTPGGGDTIAPVIQITIPDSADAYTADSGTISLGGIAADETALSTVIWRSETTFQGGTANGLNVWSVSDVQIVSGQNTITVTAYDEAGNFTTDTIVVIFEGTGSGVIVVKKGDTSFCGFLGLEALALVGLLAWTRRRCRSGRTGRRAPGPS